MVSNKKRREKKFIIDCYYLLFIPIGIFVTFTNAFTNGLSRRDVYKEIVMQGDVLAPLISSLQVDTIGKKCLEEGKHLHYFKDTFPIPPL